MARVDVVHEQQHQRNDRAAKQRTALEHQRAAFVLIPDKADRRDEHNGQNGMELQQQTDAVKVHAAVAEIGRSELGHGEQRNREPARRRAQTGRAAALILPDRCEREHPEQQRVGAEDRFHRAGRGTGNQPARLAAAVQGRRRADDEERQHVVHGLRRAADAGAKRQHDAEQCAAQRDALPVIQPRAAGKHRDAHGNQQ